MLRGKPVAQDDGIVDGQRQLQHYGDGVGNKADFSAEVIGAHIQQSRRDKRNQQHRHLHIGLGGKNQHHHNDHRRHQDDLGHFPCQLGGHVHPHGGVHIHIVPIQKRPDGRHGFFRSGGRGLRVKVHIQQRRPAAVMVPGAVKGHLRHALDFPDAVCQLPGPARGDVGDHHTGRAKAHKILIHHGKAPAGFRILRQIGGDVIFHLHPVHGKQAEYQRHHIQQEKQVPFVDNKGGDLLHRAVVSFRGHIFCHRKAILSEVQLPYFPLE